MCQNHIWSVDKSTCSFFFLLCPCSPPPPPPSVVFLAIVYSCVPVLLTQEPGYETGDVIIVLDLADHREFVRKGADLRYDLVS